jgi:hypothetical protein
LKFIPKENQPFQGGLERIRNRYTTSKMYVDEFELIWNKQSQFHSELTYELKTKFGGRKLDGYKEDGILFHQRPYVHKNIWLEIVLLNLQKLNALLVLFLLNNLEFGNG